jgi:hypothetical protein
MNPAQTVVALFMTILAGCTGSPIDTSHPTQQFQTATYLDTADEEMQRADRLVSRAVGALLTEALPESGGERPEMMSVEQVKRATKQIDAASQLLKARRYPPELPRSVHEELLAIRDSMLAAYRIKQKSLAILKKHLIHGDSYLMDEYRRLSQQSKTRQDEAHARLAGLKARFAPPNRDR